VAGPGAARLLGESLVPASAVRLAGARA